MTEVQESTISASLVTDSQRLNFLPKFFGPSLMIPGESLVYRWMGRLCDHYHGGFWNFFTLSNGGFYMAPVMEGSVRVEAEGNGFTGELTADAAGIVATLYALGSLAAATFDDRISELYHRLREYALSHHEGTQILRAID